MIASDATAPKANEQDLKVSKATMLRQLHLVLSELAGLSYRCEWREHDMEERHLSTGVRVASTTASAINKLDTSKQRSLHLHRLLCIMVS